MKNILLFLILIPSIILNAQDSLSVKHLQPITYTFQVENGKMTGKGAEFLQNEISNAQFTMLGEYHDSKRISEFTAALIPELNRLGYKNLALEVGPITGAILNTMSNNVERELNAIMNKYVLKFEKYDGKPIPFFGNKSDATFLTKAKEANWSITGIDQEFIFGFRMLADEMFGNLEKIDQEKFKTIHIKVKDSLKQFHLNNKKKRFTAAVKESQLVKDFLSKMSATAKNEKIINAFNESIRIYHYNTQRKWFTNNKERVLYMKKQFGNSFHKDNFDVSKDKLFIKMGANHLSKGFSPLRLFEVGNMLNEIAEFYGKKTFSMTFSTRFYENDGVVKDIMDSEKQYETYLNNLNQMGKKDQWVVIDLRPLIEGTYYYPEKYKIDKNVEDLMKRYDVIIIPKLEVDPVKNY